MNVEAEFAGPQRDRRIVKLVITDPDGVTAASLREVYLRQMEVTENWGVSDVGPRLDVPVARPYGQTFYERVRDAYVATCTRSSRPAPVIAEATGVPVSTVHGWIKEARRRGLMPPGRAGVVG